MFKILKWNNDYADKTLDGKVLLIQNDNYYDGQLIDNKYIVSAGQPKHWQYIPIYSLDILDVFETDNLLELDEFHRLETHGVYRYIRL